MRTDGLRGRRRGDSMERSRLTPSPQPEFVFSARSASKIYTMGEVVVQMSSGEIVQRTRNTSRASLDDIE